MSAEPNAIRITPVNESSVLLSFAEEINVEQASRVASAAAAIQKAHASFIFDCVPAYTTLLIYFDRQRIQSEKFCALLATTLASWQGEYEQQTSASDGANTVNIPVYYHPEVGPDLLHLAERKQLGIDEIIELHQHTTYTVYSIGFAPGFAYMGNVDTRIAEPRLATPRPVVAKGSVGIAGRQTGIYPQALPGGWNIVGRSPMTLFSIDEEGNPQCPYKMGDRVRFFAITREQFLAQGGIL